MCIALFMWQAHPLYPFLLLLNRDEYHNRPTTPVGWWECGQILGGKDEVAGGTWLACSRQGRVAFLTNVLELHTLPEAKTRGHLPLRFLQSKKSPEAFAEELVEEANQYNGFNLILADLCSKTMIYVSNRPKGEPILIQQVFPGIHVLSNSNLSSPWPKKPTIHSSKLISHLVFITSPQARRLEQRFKSHIDLFRESEIPVADIVKKLMNDTMKADESKLPHICSLEWELNLSSIFVEIDTPLGKYGTRSTAALTVKANGEASFYEIFLERNIWKEHTFNYFIENFVIQSVET
ncbi:transport and Golgi organization 2 [Dorcoceras hygrometricum]|uniref:Transport and Golgi organization 2 n=1 Tax=Dorcoceras hygrometricum TaxID=472368 RepID=A0A2Z7C873_9LAMI|nr:transport and Golgi organization 2 [Dorcoceras hygrometricum]